MVISKNLLMGLVIVLAVAVGVLGWQLYQNQQKSTFSLSVDKNGISVQTPK